MLQKTGEDSSRMSVATILSAFSWTGETAPHLNASSAVKTCQMSQGFCKWTCDLIITGCDLVRLRDAWRQLGSFVSRAKACLEGCACGFPEVHICRRPGLADAPWVAWKIWNLNLSVSLSWSSSRHLWQLNTLWDTVDDTWDALWLKRLFLINKTHE